MNATSEKTNTDDPATHSFAVGTLVSVLNRDISGCFFVEGKAKILSGIKGDHETYRVRFKDGFVCTRFVDPEAQDDPQGYCDRFLNSGKAGAA